MLGSLGWAWKPNSMAMWLGIVTCIPWGMLVASLPGVCNSWRDKVLHIWSLVSFLIGLVGVVFLVIYGGNIAEVRGPMIYMMWAIVSGFIVTLVIFLVWTIKHFLANGKSKDDDIVETVENDTNRILEEEAEAKKHLSNMLTGQTGTKGNPQQPQNIPIYINQRNQRLQVDQMGRPINPTGEPIFVIINNKPVQCDPNGKPIQPPQQPQNRPIYINQRNQRLQVDQMGRPINPTGEPIFVIINNRPVPCDPNGKPIQQPQQSQQPQNIPIYINQRNQRLHADPMGRPINPTGEPIFVIINNRPVPCDANGKPLMQRPSPSHQQGDYTQKASYEVQGLGTGQINEQFNSKHSGFLGSPQGRR